MTEQRQGLDGRDGEGTRKLTRKRRLAVGVLLAFAIAAGGGAVVGYAFGGRSGAEFVSATAAIIVLVGVAIGLAMPRGTRRSSSDA